jgi:cytochrome c biogenesis protein CcdA
MFAMLFLLLMVVYALAVVMPIWAAALIVGGVLAGVASVILTAAIGRFKNIHPTLNVRLKP